MIQSEEVSLESLTIPDSKTKARRRTIPIHAIIRPPLVAHLLQTAEYGYLISGQGPLVKMGTGTRCFVHAPRQHEIACHPTHQCPCTPSATRW